MNQPQKNTKPQGKKLLDIFRDQIRIKQYSTRTEKNYIHWVRKYILFHDKCHPKEMNVSEINQFITYFVVERKASASTQNTDTQQLEKHSDIIFMKPLYKELFVKRSK